MIAITTPTGPTAFDAWGLAAAWVGSGAAVLGVGVAIIFGILTLANTRRSRSALDTATIAAAQSVPPGAAPGLRANGPQPIAWAVTRAPGSAALGGRE